MASLRIGALAAATDTAVDTIRYYEREGLLAAPRRSEGNYREYGPEAVDTLRLIRHARGLGLSLDEVRELLAARAAPEGAHVDALLARHLAHVRERMAQLQDLERQLQALQGRCHAEHAGACGALAELEQAASAGASGPPVDGLHDRGDA